MLILDLPTLLSAAVLTGNELAVSLFVNPALRFLQPQPQAHALSLLARSLGQAMPFWYAATLALMAIEATLRRHQPAFPWILSAAVLWVGIIVFTLLKLVPINNRIAALDSDHLPSNWLAEHRHWDRLHRLRILLLLVATTALATGIVATR